MRRKTSNRQFARESILFRLACELAGVYPTERQASKFRQGKGEASAMRNVAMAELANPTIESRTTRVLGKDVQL
jgi:hypothetical protein